MTLDEAIIHCEEVADKCDVTDGNIKCANEHRQLAGWLKDYKRLKEQEPCDDCIGIQAALDYIYNDLGLGDEENGKDVKRQMELEGSYRYVKSLPSVTLQPKMGRWIAPDGDNAICGCCNRLNRLYGTYCKHCGAKMKESEG